MNADAFVGAGSIPALSVRLDDSAELHGENLIKFISLDLGLGCF